MIHGDRLIDGPITGYIAFIAETQRLIDLAKRPKHGWLARYNDLYYNHKLHVGKGGLTAGVLNGTARSHTREGRLNDKYRRATWHERCPGLPPPSWLSTWEDATLIKCPLCYNYDGHYIGNTEHLHISCPHKDLTEQRNHCNNAINAILHKFTILRHTAPGRPPCIVADLGNALAKEDQTPALRPDGLLDDTRHIRQTIITTDTEAQSFLRQRRLTNPNAPPPTH